MQVDVPDALSATAQRIWGEPGRQWARDLPATVAGLAADWELAVGSTFAPTHHWVAAAVTAGGQDAVLKVGFPAAGHVVREAAALEAFAGRGAVGPLRADATRGALLLERVAPGTPATALVPARDAEATAAVVEVVRQLHVPVPPGCPLPDLRVQLGALRTYLQDHPGGSPQPLPRDLVERAAGVCTELSSSAPRRVVLHGDLHHDNLLRGDLRGQDRWWAIDPHGVVGDSGYEVGAWLFNPVGGGSGVDDALLALVPARVEQLADGLDEPVERVIAWGFVKAVLSEVGTAQDGGEPCRHVLDVARLLLPLLS